MKKYIHTLVLAMAGIAMVCYYSSCKKVDIVKSTTTDVNIYEYFKENPDSFSLWLKIVDKSGYAGFLNAYGSYTMFAPTNSGVQKYLTANSKTIDGLTETESKDIVKFHLMEDTLTTASFKDGKLPLVTMYGQYLVTGIGFKPDGGSAFNINRQALVTHGNIRTGNGFIHGIDNVLIPASKTVAQLIADDPAYSIFKQALVATGYWDTLNTINTTDPSKRWMTVLAETDQALADSGFTSFNALKAKYSKTGNPMNANDSLHIYVAYHIIPDAKYLADIVSTGSHYTLQPLEVLLSKLDGETILINDLNFNGVHEQGIQIDRAKSDNSATNGVLHSAKAHFAPKVRQPFAVYWDVADFPEIRKLPAYFRKQSYNFAYGTVQDIQWDKTTNTLGYVWAGTTNNSFPVAYGDYLDIPMGNTSRHQWLDFKTPLLVKGKYKVWICYRARKGSGTLGQPGGSYMPVQVNFDGVPTSRTFAFTDQRPNLTDGEMEALGWKRYTVNTQQFMSGKYVGTIDVPTTDRHMIRLLALPPAGTGNPTNHLDMIHIIPVNMNQYLPRFDQLGNPVYN
jgi:uncharacterized surface protein with fasciclin (FAS1) repeats